MAACAYPGHFAACRALVQLSSRAILQTAWHVGPIGGVRLAFGENTFRIFLCASLLPVHGVILNPRVFAVRFTLHSASVWLRGCMFFGMAWRNVAKTVLEAFV